MCLFDISAVLKGSGEVFVGPSHMVNLYMAFFEERLQNWFLCSQFKVIIEFAINNLKYHSFINTSGDCYVALCLPIVFLFFLSCISDTVLYSTYTKIYITNVMNSWSCKPRMHFNIFSLKNTTSSFWHFKIFNYNNFLSLPNKILLVYIQDGIFILLMLSQFHVNLSLFPEVWSLVYVAWDGKPRWKVVFSYQ